MRKALAQPHTKQFLKFAVVGLISFGIDWGMLIALVDSTVSICIEQLAQILDLAANLGASIGVARLRANFQRLRISS